MTHKKKVLFYIKHWSVGLAKSEHVQLDCKLEVRGPKLDFCVTCA